MIGCILKSTLYLNRKNSDCMMLCRFCGIDIGDGLIAKIDDKNFYYDDKLNVFTLFEQYMNWEQFAIFKHWIRRNNLNIIGGIQNDKNIDFKTLQRVCQFLGMDNLSNALFNKVKENELFNTSAPSTPHSENKPNYVWNMEKEAQEHHAKYVGVIDDTIQL